MLIVVLVMAMLMGVGMFAARSATLAVNAGGYNRQMTQTHYWTEFAMLTATAELSTSRKGGYVSMMQEKPSTNCASAKTGTSGPFVSNYTCYVFGFADLEQSLLNEGSNKLIIDPAGATPGSLGKTQIEARFSVEMTDLAPASPPVEGQDLTGGGALQYRSVTLNANGQIRLPSGTSGSAASASTELARARLIIGPLAK